MKKNGELFRAFEDVVFSEKLYNIPVEFRLPRTGEKIVVRTWGNVFRGGSGIVIRVFPRDGIFIAEIGGKETKYAKEKTSQCYWQCVEVERCEWNTTACIAALRKDGGLMMLFAP